MGTKQFDNYADLITFTRASGATLLDRDGLLKRAGHNLLTYSEEFDNGAWDAGAGDFVVSADATTAPDGTSSADKIIVPNGSAFINASGNYVSDQEVSQNLGALAEGNYTFSIYAKIGEYSQFQLRATSNPNLGSAFGVAKFNLSDGSVDGTTLGIDAGSTSVGNGWYRLYITFNKSISGDLYVGGWVWNGATPATGNGSDGIYLWGAHLYRSDMPMVPNRNSGWTAETTYYPTTSAAYEAPRIEYDADGNRLGLLVEEQRTNNFLYSEDLSDAVWELSAGATVTANGNLARVELASGIQNRIQQTVSATVGNQTHTVSAWVRSYNGGSDQTFRLKCTHAGVGGFFSDDLTATSDWQFFSFSQAFGAGGTGAIAGVANDSLFSAADIEVQYLQLELNTSFPTSYIPTSGSTATRAADVASIPTSAFGYNASEGTLFAGISSYEGNPKLLHLNDGSDSNRAQITATGSAVSGYVQATGDSGSFISVAGAPTVPLEAALGIKTNDMGLTVNGSSVSTDTSQNVPVSITKLNIGSGASGVSSGKAHIKSIKYYPRRLINAQLQALTEG